MRPTALLLVVAVLFTHPAHGQDFIAAADKAAPSIVTVISTNDAGTPAQVSAVTTGVIVSADGLVLASYHAVSSFEAISVRLADGAGYDAAVHGFDEFRGLALLKLAAEGLIPIEFADSDNLRVGQWVASAGNQFGIEKQAAPTFSVGIIGALNCSIPSLSPCSQLIKTDAAMNPGSIGGPLIDSSGRAVGINIAICSMTGGWQGVGYAVPANYVVNVIEQLKKGSRKERGWLGVSIGCDGRVHVAGVVPDSPAEDAGIQVGDVILAFNGRPVADTIDLMNLVAATAPGSKADVTIERDGAQRKLQVVVASRPRSFSCFAPNRPGTPEDAEPAAADEPDTDLTQDFREAREKISGLVQDYICKLKDPKLVEQYRKAFRDLADFDLQAGRTIQESLPRPRRLRPQDHQHQPA